MLVSLAEDMNNEVPRYMVV